MSRTWQQNSDSINGLWPHCQWTDEEIDLWRSDLSGLDQDVLFEAIREVKRSRDTLYPQLAWVHAAYRTLAAAKRAAERTEVLRDPAFSGEKLVIDKDESCRLAEELSREIDAAAPEDVDELLAKIDANFDRMEAVVAARLLIRAGGKRVVHHPAEESAPATIKMTSDEDFEAARAEMLRQLRESK